MVSCCLDWGSSSDLGGTSSVSSSANPSDWGELPQGERTPILDTSPDTRQRAHGSGYPAIHSRPG